MRFRFSLLLIYTVVSSVGVAQTNIENILEKSRSLYNENPAESFSLCETAEREAKETGDHSQDGSIAYCKGRYYLLIAKYDASSTELNKAINIFTENDDKLNLSSTYSLKSILLQRIGDEAAAHTMLLKVLELDREANNVNAMIRTLSNLSLDYKKMNDADSMLYCLNELESLSDQFYASDYLYYYQNWGHYYVLTKDYPRAIQQFHLALNVAEEQKMTDSKATNLAAVSRV
jgi:tetratricopeptide (TPR) repeat protein